MYVWIYNSFYRLICSSNFCCFPFQLSSLPYLQYNNCFKKRQKRWKTTCLGNFHVSKHNKEHKGSVLPDRLWERLEFVPSKRDLLCINAWLFGKRRKHLLLASTVLQHVEINGVSSSSFATPFSLLSVHDIFVSLVWKWSMSYLCVLLHVHEGWKATELEYSINCISICLQTLISCFFPFFTFQMWQHIHLHTHDSYCCFSSLFSFLSGDAFFMEPFHQIHR